MGKKINYEKFSDLDFEELDKTQSAKVSSLIKRHPSKGVIMKKNAKTSVK